MMSSGYRFFMCLLSLTFILSLAIISYASAETCIHCHPAVIKQFRGNSHHVQGVETTGRHCYACHWEAAEDGAVNSDYHRNIPSVNLVVWVDGKRPVDYLNGKTAVSFTPEAIGTGRERDDVEKVTVHCLSCHNDASLKSTPFAGDPNTPATYAWDRESIASRYSRMETTSWGKYSTATTNRKKQVKKALSAHGNAAANEGGWREMVGYDGDMTLSRGGKSARNVGCFDCHNSHGSTVAGVTSSYSTSDRSANGGILKQTTSGQSGYKMDYQPSVNSYKRSSNPFNPGAGLCFDCHESSSPGATPWGYSATFGATGTVMGYKDTVGFGDGIKGSSGKYGVRQGRGELASSHLKSGAPLQYPPSVQINGLCTPCHDPHGVSRTLGENFEYAVPLLKGSWLTSPYREDGPPDRIPARNRSGIDGEKGYNAVNRISASNFPVNTDHNRVNRESGSNFNKEGPDYNRVNRDAGSNFAKEPLKPDYNRINRDANSNFATERSEYNRINRDSGSNFTKENADFNRVNRDSNSNFSRAADKRDRETDANSTNRDANSNFAKSSGGAPREPLQGMKYHVDRNTFGPDQRIRENDYRFAGLCLACHKKESLTGTSRTAMVHRTVKGWGSNIEHSFPCSKCHQAHNSGLPRLMQTNCFEKGPVGMRGNSAAIWASPAESAKKDAPGKEGEQMGGKVVGCHVRQFSRAGSFPENAGWREVSPW